MVTRTRMYKRSRSLRRYIITHVTRWGGVHQLWPPGVSSRVHRWLRHSADLPFTMSQSMRIAHAPCMARCHCTKKHTIRGVCLQAPLTCLTPLTDMHTPSPDLYDTPHLYVPYPHLTCMTPLTYMYHTLTSPAWHPLPICTRPSPHLYDTPHLYAPYPHLTCMTPLTYMYHTLTSPVWHHPPICTRPPPHLYDTPHLYVPDPHLTWMIPLTYMHNTLTSPV